MNWIPIPGWESRYEINERGDIRSKDMIVSARSGCKATRKGRQLALVRKNNGYLSVTLTDGQNRPQIGVHRLVARAFLGECPIGLHVLHTDGDKTNNHFSNLRYGTPAENVADTAKHGRQRRGEIHPLAKIDEDAVRMIRLSSKSCKELASLFSLSAAHISSIRRGRVWRHTL
jgi:hypothetical protein